MKKQGFLYGSVILIMSVIITKLIGALFKIPLTNILGGTGMGYFSSAYGIFMPVYAISVTGIPAAIAKMTAENCAIERYSNVKKIHRISLLSFTFIGLILSGIIIVLSVPFCRYVIETPGAFPSVVIIAPSIFFGCVMSVYRGYYEGLRNMYPTAVSQVIEAMIKLIAGLGLCWYTFKLASDCPEKFFHIIKNLGADIVIENGITDISQLIIPYASAAAVLGVTLSSFGGMFFLIIRHKIYGDGITKDQINRDKVTDSRKQILSSLIKIVIPVAIGSLITNLTSLIDLATIIRFMNDAINKAPEIFSISDISLNETANFYYGSFTGLSVTVFNLIPAFTNMFGKGILPGLTEAWAIKDKEKITKSVTSVLTVTCLIALPSGIGISFMAKEILEFLFSSRTQEILISSKSLTYLGIGVVFLSLSTPIFAMFQAIGKASVPVKIMAVGVIIKLIGNIILIPIPSLNINGAAISTTACYIVIFFISIILLTKYMNIKIKFSSVFVKPLYSAMMCGITARLCYDVLSGFVSDKIALISSITSGGIIYLILLYLLNYINKAKIKSFF